MFLMIGIRHEHFNVLANDFIGFITKEFLCGKIIGLHGSYSIDGNNAIHRRVYDCLTFGLTHLQLLVAFANLFHHACKGLAQDIFLTPRSNLNRIISLRDRIHLNSQFLKMLHHGVH